MYNEDHWDDSYTCIVWLSNSTIPTVSIGMSSGGLGGVWICDGTYEYNVDTTPNVIVEPIIQSTSSVSNISVITSNVEHGTVTEAEPRANNSFILTATPALGYGFDHWEYSTVSNPGGVDWTTDDAATAQGAVATVTITQDTVYRAVFAPVKLSLGNSRIEVRTGGDGGFSTAINEKGYLLTGAPGKSLSTDSTEYHAGDIVRFWFEYSLSGDLEGTRPIYFAIYEGKFTAEQLEKKIPIREINASLAAGFGGSGADENGYRPSVKGQYTAFLRTEELPEEITHITLAAKLGDADVIVKTYDITLSEWDKSDWVETVVSALNVLEPTIVKVPRGATAIEAFMSAMNKAYPKDYAGGTWFIDAHGGAFGLFLNFAGVDPTLQRYRVVDTYNGYPGGATYGMNGVFCDLGSGSWKLYGGEVQTWAGLEGSNAKEKDCRVPTRLAAYTSPERAWAIAVLRDSGVSDDDITAYIAEALPGWTADDLKTRFASGNDEFAERMTWKIADEITAIFDPVKAAIDEIEGKTGDGRTQAVTAARSAFNTLKNTKTFFGSNVYFNSLFTRYEPYKTAYENLIAAEKTGGVTTPLPTVTAAEALSAALEHIKTSTPAPIVNSQGGEWAVLALARGGAITDAIVSAYLANLDAALATADSDSTSITDRERITLALSSLGIDASAYGESPVDLTAMYKDSDFNTGHNNALIFALLALDSKPYDGARGEITYDEYEGTETVGDGLIKRLLDKQLEGGGWSDSDTLPDIDTTAMAIQALAPSYNTSITVHAAIDKALAWLKAQQKENGGFAGFGNAVENSTCSAAQVITALSALGTDPASWETTGGQNLLTAMLTNYNAEGWFGEGDNITTSTMATEQAAYALVAYERMLTGQNPLYVMSDAFTRASDAGVASVVVYYDVQTSVTATTGEGTAFTAEIPYGAEVSSVTVTPAYHRATASNPKTTDNGKTWTFTVTPQNGTAVLYTLTVTNAANPAADNEDAVTAAKAAIEAVQTWTVDMQTANDKATVKTWLETNLAKLELGGVIPSVTVNTVNAAVSGADSNKAGTPGSFAAAVALTIGSSADQTLAEGSAVISAVNTSITPTVFISNDASAVSVTVGNKAVSLTPGTSNFDVVLDYAEDAELPTEISAEAIKTADADVKAVDISGPVITDNVATWTFTVTAEDGTTVSETYTINVRIAADPAEGTKFDVGTAKNTIEAHNWTVPADVAEVDVWITEQLAALSLNEVTATPALDDVTPAIPGTPDAPNGSPGSFTATVALEKGEEEARATGSATISGALLAIPYVFSTDTSIASVTVQGETAEQTTAYALSVTLPHTAQPVEQLDIIVVTTDEKASYEIEQGATGAWTITVTAESGATATYTLNVTILANPNAANAKTVADAAVYLEDAMFSVPMSTANGEAEVRTWLAGRIAAMSPRLGGVEYAVGAIDVTPAEAGTAEAPSGKPGSFTASVSLAKGEGETLATGAASVAGTITATPFKQGGGTGTDKQITVTFRLVGATLSENDVNMKDAFGDWQGSGYQTWIATRSYAMYEGQSNYDLFVEALRTAGLTAVGQDKNYVETVYAPSVFGGYKLSEFTNGKFSGWMYTVKHAGSQQRLHVGYGLKEQPLYDGDEVIWHYVNDYRFEVNDWFNDPGYPALGDASVWNKWLEAADVNPSQGSVPTTPGAGDPADPDAPDDKTPEPGDAETPPGGGGGAETPPPVATETVETKPTVNAGTGKATATVETATVTKAVDDAKKAVADAKASGDATAKAEVKIIAKAEPSTAGAAATPVKSVEVDIPAEAFKAVAESKELVLTVESDVSTLTLDTATLTAIAETAKDGETIKIAAETVDTTASLNDRQREKVGDNPVIEVNITVGTTAITNLGGTVTVSVPYTPPATVAETDQDLLTVYYLDDDGNITEMKGAKYDAATGKITFATTHFSKFLISEWINPFEDIAKGEWFYKAARYAYSNALITGTTDTTFAPQATLTRAMLATILYRNAVGGGVPDAPPSPETLFTDVAPGQWYTPAIAWASSNGLITGVGNNKFAPNDPITREQFATLLYRYTQWSDAGNGTSRAASPTDANLSAYTDAEDISDWAKEAMAWAVANGLVTGRTETTLAPQIPATRSEAAMLLQRYLENTK
ncbi:MAG: S-layer homology domain-containing protein [Oscillospiraceae bacterium]|nr:S-layer homology domain-containing protein [Oscillospiraceae bacterium]